MTYECRRICRECLTPLCQQTRMPVSLGLTRAMAGPNPLHSAFTPSAAIVFRAQSMIPEYVPVGADCNLDFRT
jgi:hypothetical protein